MLQLLTRIEKKEGTYFSNMLKKFLINFSRFPKNFPNLLTFLLSSASNILRFVTILLICYSSLKYFLKKVEIAY